MRVKQITVHDVITNKYIDENEYCDDDDDDIDSITDIAFHFKEVFSQHHFMTWNGILNTPKKKKNSVDSNSTFSSYAWLCVSFLSLTTVLN